MTKQELRDLARIGYVSKLKAIEAELAAGFKMFPDVFVDVVPPQLVRPELRNGHAPWPQMKATKKATKKGKHAKTTTQPGGHWPRLLKQRKATADLLASVADGVTTYEGLKTAGHNPRSVGSLVRRKYLSKHGDEYKRTKKTYRVDPREAS